jgi:Arc/MetJ family transcription regulator
MHNFSYTITLTAMKLYSQKNMVYSLQIEIDVLFVLLTMSEFVLLTMSEFVLLTMSEFVY